MVNTTYVEGNVDVVSIVADPFPKLINSFWC